MWIDEKNLPAKQVVGMAWMVLRKLMQIIHLHELKHLTPSHEFRLTMANFLKKSFAVSASNLAQITAVEYLLRSWCECTLNTLL